jgi:hypothetical protein
MVTNLTDAPDRLTRPTGAAKPGVRRRARARAMLHRSGTANVKVAAA